MADPKFPYVKWRGGRPRSSHGAYARALGFVDWHTQAELAELLGSRSRASEILLRRRALTVDMIHRISETWKIPADLLVRPYKTKRAA
jgi:hypothetical protein